MVSRADLTCHNCNTTGLEERSRTADQFGTDRKELIYATKCPDCGERVDPAHIRQQLPDEPDTAMSTTEQLVEYTKSLSIQTAAMVVGVFLLVIALSITGIGGGGSGGLSPGEDAAAQSPDTAVLTGTIEGPNGDGLDNATVSVVGNDLSTATDSDGSYRLDSVPTGSQALVVTTPGSTYPNLTREVSVSESESPVTEYYTVEPVEEVSTAETSDGESVETSDGGSTATLIGTVENGAGESIDDSAVAVDGPDSFDETVDTGSDGRYRVNDVPSGDVDIEVSHNDYDTASRQISVSGSDSTVEEYFELEAESEPDADVTLVGTVENDSSGAAIDDATIRVADEDIDEAATTDSEGQYRLTGLPTGEYEVVVEHPQYESYRTTLDPSSADASLTGYYELDHKVTEWATTLSTASSGVPNRTSDRIELDEDPPATQTLTIASPITTERVTMGDTARGRQELVLPGNRMPTNMTLTISGEASTSNETVTASVGPNTTNTTLPVAVDGDLPTNVTVEIEPTTNTTAASAAGTVAAGVETQNVSLAGNGDINQLTATVRGVENLTAHNQSASGDATLPVTYRGNEPAVGPNGTGQPTLTITGAGAAPTTTGANGTADHSSTISLPPDGEVTGTPEIVVEGTNTTGNTTTVPLSNGTIAVNYQGNQPAVGPAEAGHPAIRVIGAGTNQSPVVTNGTISGRTSIPVTTTSDATVTGINTSTPTATVIGNTQTANDTTQVLLASNASTSIPYRGNAPAKGPNGTSQPILNLTGSTVVGNTTTVTGTLNNGTSPIDIAGTIDPTGPNTSETPRLTIIGNETTATTNLSRTVAAGDSTTLDIAENQGINATVTFAANRTVHTPETVELTDSDAVNVSGNQPPEGSSNDSPPEVTIYGSEQMYVQSSDSVRNQSGDSYNINTENNTLDQNVRITDPVLNLTGVTNSEWNNVSETVSTGESDIISEVGGNLDPTGPSAGEPEVTLTGIEKTNYPSVDRNLNDQSQSVSINPDSDATITNSKVNINGYQPSSNYRAGTFLQGPESYTTTVTTSGSQGDSAYLCVDRMDVGASYSISGPSISGSVSFSSGEAYSCKEVDGYVGDHVNVDHDLTTNPDNSAGSFDNVDIPKVQIRGEAADSAYVNGDYVNLDGSGATKNINIDGNTGSVSLEAQGGAANFNINWDERIKTTNPELTVDGGQTFTPTLNPGESETYALPNLAHGSSGITAQTSKGDMDVELRMKERTQTENVDIQVNGEPVSHSGSLSDDVTETISLPDSTVDRGSNTISVDSVSSGSGGPAGSIKTALEWTEVHGTHEPSVTVGNQSTTLSSTLYANETETVELPGIESGSQTVAIDQTSGPTPEANLTYNPVVTTESPGIDTNGDGVAETQHTGLLTDNETATVNVSLPSGSNRLNWTTAGGSVADVAISAVGRTTTEGIEIGVGDTETDDVTIDGPLADNETETVNLTELDVGANELSTTNENGSATYQLEYTPRTTPTNISVVADNTTTITNHSAPLPDGEHHTTTLPLNSSVNLTVSTDHAAVDNATVTYRRVNATENVSLDIGDNGTADATINKTLTAGDTERVDLPNLTAGVNTISASARYAPANYSLRYEVGNATANISVTDTNGSLVGARSTPLLDGQNWTTPVTLTDDPTFNVTANGSDNYDAELVYRPRNATENVTVSTDTNTTTVAAGELAAGETANTTLPGIDSETETVTIHAAHAPADYNLTLSSGTATHNITVTDANGSTVAHRDRPLPSGENMSVDVPISSNRTLNVTADGNSNYTSWLAYQARNATENVAIETTGDADPEVDTDAISPGSATTYTVPVNASNATISAIGPVAYELDYSATSAPEDVALTAGNTTQQLNGTVTTDRTVTLQDIEPGTDELRVDAAHSGMNVSAAWVDRSGTVDPTITHVGTGEVLCRVEGPLSGTHNCSLPNDAISTMTPTIDITTTAGQVDYELAMDGRAVAEDAMVRVNGLPTSYPESFADSSGELPTTLDDGATREIGSLSGRTSRVFVESEPVDGIDTQVETQISFSNDSAS